MGHRIFTGAAITLEKKKSRDSEAHGPHRDRSRLCSSYAVLTRVCEGADNRSSKIKPILVGKMLWVHGRFRNSFPWILETNDEAGVFDGYHGPTLNQLEERRAAIADYVVEGGTNVRTAR
jgi:hypothetical protein